MSVEIKIEKIIKDAVDKNIFGIASNIARNLGNGDSKNHGTNWKFIYEKLVIDYDDYGANISIDYDKTQVFSVQTGTVLCYRPDVEEWIQSLFNVNEKILKPILDRKEAEKKRLKDEEIFIRWGIKPDEVELQEFEKQGITEDWEKHGLACPYEDPTTCDVCSKWGCRENTNPEKEKDKNV